MIFMLGFVFSLAIASEKPSLLVSLDPELPEQRVIHVGDVAKVRGLNPSTQIGVEKIVLSLSSQEYRRLSKIDLIRTLRSELSVYEQECDCEIQLVFTNNEKQDQEFSIELVQKELAARLQNLCGECIYQISNLNVMRGQVPDKFSKWSLQEDLRDLRGASMVRVYFDEQVLNPMVLQGWIKVQKPLVVLKKSMMKGMVPSAADFEIQNRDITNDYKVFASSSDIVGKELKRSINEAHVLTLEDLVDKQVVRLGESVAVEIKNGAIFVEMTGIAQKSGKMGDRIPIRVTKTQKQITAEIVAESRVRLE